MGEGSRRFGSETRSLRIAVVFFRTASASPANCSSKDRVSSSCTSASRPCRPRAGPASSRVGVGIARNHEPEPVTCNA